MTSSHSIQCKRCGYDATTKASLIRHLQRKNPCAAGCDDDSISIDRLIEELVKRKDYNDITYDCPFCQKKFNHSSNMYSHKKICKKRSTQENFLQNRFSQLEQDMQNIQQQINDIAISQTYEQINIENKKKIEALELALKLAKEDKSEETYQRLLEKYRFPGATHTKLASGVTDITTETVHAEIKKYDCWKEAIGQLLAYNKNMPRSELHVYLFGKYSKICKQNAVEVFQEMKIKPYEVIVTKDSFVIVDLTTGDTTLFDLDDC